MIDTSMDQMLLAEDELNELEQQAHSPAKLEVTLESPAPETTQPATPEVQPTGEVQERTATEAAGTEPGGTEPASAESAAVEAPAAEPAAAESAGAEAPAADIPAAPAAAPTATAAEVESLFERYQRTGDVTLRDHLVMLHLNLVRFLASKFANRGEPLEDLVQVGTIGLINAVDRFDPSRGNKFSTYAAPTIVGEIKRHFRDKAWNLKVPRRLQELNLAAGKAVEVLTQSLGRGPTIPEIAKHINASEEETLEAIELGNAYETVSLDSRLDSQGDSGPMTLAEFIGDEDADLQNINSFDDLREAIHSLDEREQAIIKLRFFSDLSQTEVAQRLKISQMHVSRLQQKALKKLKSILAES